MEERLIRLVSAHGPRNFSKIAHDLNVSRKTAVAAYERLTEEGLGPRPNIRMRKLGLQRYAAIARPGSNSNPGQLASVFATMGDYAYLEHYQKLDPSSAYLLIFSCPPDLVQELNIFLSKMARDSMFSVVGPVALDWMRYHPIRAPWSPTPTSPLISGPLDYIPEKDTAPRAANLEYGELLLLAALQAFPNANLAGLSQALSKWADAGYADLKSYSMASNTDWNSLLQKSMRYVDSFPVHRSRGEPGVSRRRKHHWASFTLLWDGLSKDDIKRAALASTSVPYLRTDAAAEESGLYFSVISAPTSLIPGYVSFMSRNAPEKMNVGIPSHFANYSLPFAAYVPGDGRWAWKQERLETVLASLQAE